MHTPLFKNAPITRFLLIGLLITSFTALAQLAAREEARPVATRRQERGRAGQTSPRSAWFEFDWNSVVQRGEWWRLCGLWQAAYTSPAELLCGCVTIYQLRVLERLWGSRKLGKFLLRTLPYTIILPPLTFRVLGLLLPPSTKKTLSILPSGPTTTLYVLLSQYYELVPYTWRYSNHKRDNGRRPAARPSDDDGGVTDGVRNTRREMEAREEDAVMITSKSSSYIPALQLAFGRFPGSVVAAFMGWGVGWAMRWGLLPGFPAA